MFRSEALKNRAFRDLWLGQAISQMGDAFYYITFMFMVKKVTGSTAMVGVVGVLETLPYLLLGPHAGVLADRMDRRRIMLLSDLVSAGTLILFASIIFMQGKPPVAMMLVTVCLLTCVRCYFMPAKSAAIPSIVPGPMLMRANALSQTTANIMPLLGLGLSAGVLGILYATSPSLFFGLAVLINATSFLGSAWFISRLPKILPERQISTATHAMSDFKAGIRFINGRHDLKVLIVLLTLFRLGVAPFFVVYVAANDLWFGGKPQTLAWFEFSFCVGMIGGNWAMTKFNPRHPTQFFMAGLSVCGISVGLMAVSPWTWAFVVLNVLAGLSIPFADLPWLTYSQRSVPNEYQGRVNAITQMTATGAMPIGMGVGGVMVERYGVVVGFAGMGVIMVVGTLLGLLDRQFRRVVMPDEVHISEPTPSQSAQPALHLQNEIGPERVPSLP